MEPTSEERHSLDTMFPVVYERLRALAERWMSWEPAGHTLQATALVHDAFLRLRTDRQTSYEPQHFVGIVAITMRRILIEHARRNGALKRGGDHRRIPLTRAGLLSSPDPAEALVLEEALERLAGIDPVCCSVVVHRYLLECGVEETAKTLGISPAKVKKDCRFAKSWLQVELQKGMTR